MVRAIGPSNNSNRWLHLRVASFNVKNMFDEVDDPNKDDGPPIWEWRKDYISDIIAKSDADIIGFQEVENQKVLMDTLRRRALQEKYKYVYVAPSDGRGIAVALASKYPIKKVIVHNEKFKDITGGETSFKRPVIEAIIEVAPGFDVRTFVVHFKSKRNDGVPVYRGMTSDQVQRYSEANHLRELASQGNLPTIVMGDMNDTPDSPTISLVKGEATSRGPNGNTGEKVLYDTAKLTGKENVPTHHSRHGSSKLDYIMVSGDLKDYVEDFKVYKPGTDQRAQMVSDHYMVMADLRIPLDKFKKRDGA